MWSRQIQALLNGYGLAGYITGSIPTPPATITTDEVVTVNQPTRLTNDRINSFIVLYWVLYLPPFNPLSLQRRRLQRSGRSSPPPTQNQPAATSNNSGSRSNNGRKAQNPLTSTCKDSLPDLISSPFSENHTTWRTRLNSSWKVYLMTINKLSIRYKAVRFHHRLLRSTRSCSIRRSNC